MLPVGQIGLTFLLGGWKWLLVCLISCFLQNYQEALRYIGKLPYDQAESNMKRYGKILMHHVPNETTELLKILCTDYRPSGDCEGPGMLEVKKVGYT